MALGDLPLINEIITTTEEFNSYLHGYTKETNIHEVIKIHFGNKIKPKPSQKPLIASRELSQLLPHHVAMYKFNI